MNNKNCIVRRLSRAVDAVERGRSLKMALQKNIANSNMVILLYVDEGENTW